MNIYDQPLVTVIVPVYNTEKYLNDCIHSILAQTYRNFQLILVDDGSTDRSGAICEKFAMQDDRIFVIHTDNHGLCHTRNVGIEHANGEYIFFVDSDDQIDDTFIINLLPTGNEDLVYGGYRNILPDGSENVFKHPCETISCNEIRACFLSKQITFVWCACYKRKIIIDCGLRFDESAVLCEDVAFNLDYLEYCKSIRFTDFAEYLYYQRPLSALNRFHANRIEKNRSECIKVELFTHTSEKRIRWFYWKATLNHYSKWKKNKDSSVSAEARSLFNRTLHDPYFRESIPFIRAHGSLDERIESYFMHPILYALFRPIYRCVLLLSKLKKVKG